MSEPGSGALLPLLLMNAFRDLIDELHDELERRGFVGVRPWHGFALQAVAHGADTASTLGVALGVSKQAAATTITRLERDGYLRRVASTSDQRARPVALAARGQAVLAESAVVLDAIRARWADELGPRQLAALERGLGAVTRGEMRTDLASWLTGGA